MSNAQADYPDWTRVDQQVGNPIVNRLGDFNVAGVRFYGPFFMSPWESVTVTASGAISAGDYVTVKLFWFADLAMTQAIASQTAQYKIGSTLADQFAVMGPYLNVSVDWGTGGGAVATNLIVLPRRAMHGWSRSVGDSRLLTFAAIAVGAGLTVRTPILTVTSGRAHLHVDTAGTLWVATIETLDATNTVDGSVGQVFGQASNIQSDFDIVLPPVQCQLAIQNGDGVARNYRGALTVDTSW